jgi:hypothetical protein
MVMMYVKYPLWLCQPKLIVADWPRA